MTEFAFSGLGINPHYGTPRNPYDRKAGRIPGGSSVGRGGVGHRRHGVRRARHRYRRLVPHSGGAVRHRRLQADGASRSDAGRVPALDLARFDRSAGARRSHAAPCSTRCWPASRSPTAAVSARRVCAWRCRRPWCSTASSRRSRRRSRPRWPRCARPARASSIFRCASSTSLRQINAKGGWPRRSPTRSIAR